MTQTHRPRLPVTILLDTSESMAPLLDDVTSATAAALDAAWASTLLRVRPQVGVVTAGTRPQVLVSHGEPFEPGDLGTLQADGRTDLEGAITVLAEDVERCTRANLDLGATTLQPWVLLVTDGRWGAGTAEEVISRLHGPPTPPVVHPVGVGALDETALSRVAAVTSGVVVDTPADLDAVLATLVRSIVAAGGHAQDVPTPAGSRPLEGW